MPAGTKSVKAGTAGASGSAAVWKHAAYCVPQLTLMFGLTMPIALLGALADDPELGLDNAGVNAALAAGSMMRALGKLVNGVSVDVFGVRRFLGVVLLLAAGAACLFGLARGQATLVLAFGLLQYSSSGAWLAGCKVIERGFRKEEWAGCFSALATCSRLGSMLARLCLGAMLVSLQWRQIALICAGALLLCWAFAVHVLLNGKDLERPPELEEVDEIDPKANDIMETEATDTSTSPKASLAVLRHLQLDDDHSVAEEPVGRSARIRRMLCNRGLQLQACIVAGATCLMALENMCPMMLKDLTTLGNAEIGMYATLFPTGVLAGVICWPQVYARVRGPRMKLFFELGLQAVALVSIGALGWFCSRGEKSPESVRPACFLICLVGIAVGVALNYYIKPGMHTLEFGEDCATASSFLDGVGQLAAVSFQAAASGIFRYGGTWAHVAMMLAGCLLVMLICTILLFCERNELPASKLIFGPGAWNCHAKSRIGVPLLIVTCMCILRLSSTDLTFQTEVLLRRHIVAPAPP